MQNTIKILSILIVSTLLNASNNWVPIMMDNITTFVPYYKNMNPNNIDTISAQNTEATLTLSMNGAFEKGSHGSFFIDADNDSSTGYSADTVKGADYLVQGTILYQYNGDGNSWKWNKISSSVHSTQTLNTITSVIPLNMMDTVGDRIKYIASISLPNWKYRKNYTEMVEHQMLGDNNPSVIIGARPVASTPLEKGKLFASPNGGGNVCSKSNPCNIYTAFMKIKSGDVLFLRGGTYSINKQLLIEKKGTKDAPVIIESYPGEWAIIKGKFISGEYGKTHKNEAHVGIKVIGEYAYIRKLEVMNMGHEGIILLYASHNVVEGCKLHDNLLPGIVAYGGKWHENDPKYTIPYQYGYNVIRDNIVYNNSDVGMGALTADGKPADGGNADGIAISSGKFNRVVHNTVYGNSDDGIDTWRSNDSYVAYNLVYDNGRAQGDGNGIKAGGNVNQNAGNGLRCVVEHNIAYDNKTRGFDYNTGIDVIFRFNTSYKNGLYGFSGVENTTIEYNIASKNAQIYKGQEGTNNSWNKGAQVRFISTDIHSPNFLKPVKGSGFGDIGAYSNMGDNENNQAKIFVIGDSTTFNHDTRDAQGNLLEMGWAENESLGRYMKNANNLYDEGRSGASSKSYKTVLNNQHDWEETKELIQNTDISQGAYLLIQFGHNDEKRNQPYGTTLDEFHQELTEYVVWAKNNKIIPILLTPLERRAKSKGNLNHKTHEEAGGYAQEVRALAQEKDVILLDLQKKSWNEYNKYEDSAAINAVLAYDDNTHLSPKGAKIVAGWVKELICQSNAQRLCAEFK